METRNVRRSDGDAKSHIAQFRAFYFIFIRPVYSFAVRTLSFFPAANGIPRLISPVDAALFLLHRAMLFSHVSLCAFGAAVFCCTVTG